MTATPTLADRALAVLAVHGVLPPTHKSPKPHFDADGWRWLPVFGQGKGWRGWTLDLDDDGNKGRLLAAVQRAWDEPFIGVCSQDGDTWDAVRPADYHPENLGDSIGKYITGDTLAEVLIVALECAP